MRLLLDTNILVEHLRGVPTWEPLFDAFSQGTLDLSISVLSKFETLAFPSINETEEAAALLLLQKFFSYIVDDRIANMAGLLRRRYKRKPIDLLIAATALTNDLPLVTRNRRDFQNIEGLTVYSDPSFLS